MKKNIIFSLILASSLLTACGKDVAANDSAVTPNEPTSVTSATDINASESPKQATDDILSGLHADEADSIAKLIGADFEKASVTAASETAANTTPETKPNNSAPASASTPAPAPQPAAPSAANDNTDPIVLNSGSGSCHLVNTPFDLNDYVGYADDCDRTPTLTYTGSVDPNTVGSYPLTATVTDHSGNIVTWDLTINVVNNIPQYTSDFEQMSFSDFRTRYAGEGRKFGIDVSTWQGNIDFNAVKNAGCDFVIIRIGYYYDHIVTDDYFRQNLNNARAAGLPVGIYFYTTDNSESGVRQHARWIADMLGGTPLDFPVAFDWEEFGNFQQYHMSINDLNNYYLAFADEMNKCGYSAMLYSSKNFFVNFWNETVKASTPNWLAHYVDSTDYTGKYSIWQASCAVKIDGIAGNVDMNVLYDSLPLS